MNINELIKEIKTLLEEYDIEDLKDIVIEEGNWIDDGKYSYCDTIIEYEEKLFCIRQKRSGSYFTDYEYLDPFIYPVKAETVTKTIYVKI